MMGGALGMNPSNGGSQSFSLRITGIGVASMICAAMSPIKLNFIGELHVVELILPLLALGARLAPGGDRGIREPVFGTLLVAGAVMLSGYVLSDLIQGTRPDQYLRGWGRVGLVVLDFICLAILFGQDPRNLWWYAIGSGLGGMAFLRIAEHAPLSLWKFGYADPALVLSAAMSVFMPARLRGHMFLARWVPLATQFQTESTPLGGGSKDQSNDLRRVGDVGDLANIVGNFWRHNRTASTIGCRPDRGDRNWYRGHSAFALYWLRLMAGESRIGDPISSTRGGIAG